MSDAVRQIVILGGGSAGWLTAGLIAAEHCVARDGALQVTVIESPDIAPIGVGEGTWPSMRDTLRRIGVTETDFVRECDASFKQGSRFDGWVNARPDDCYFHPFAMPHGYGEADLVAGWLERHPAAPFANLVSSQPHLCTRGKAPKQFATPEYAAVANYAYHLDAGKFGVFLSQHCTQKLGVRLVADHVTGINSHDSGDIASLQTRSNGAIAGDLFIDCSGMQSLLLGRHYEIPLLSQKHVLFNDTALALQVPYATADTPIASQTISTAQGSGWIWDIGLPTRRGVGHVYSSAHTSDDAAERELRSYIAATGGPQNPGAARRISFSPAYREKLWHRNCVAVGLSAGFIEPLEASALALVEMSAAMVCDQMPATREHMEIVARRFNDAFSYRWGRVIDFLKLHYALSQRTDTAYWHDNRRAESIPERLREMLLLWRRHAPSRYDLSRAEEIFPWASYQYVLYGMGFRPQPGAMPRRPEGLDRADASFNEVATVTRKMLSALPDNRELISHITRNGLSRI